MFTEDRVLSDAAAVPHGKQLQMFCKEGNTFIFRAKKFRRTWTFTNTAVRT
jgi:hypothetical protein